MSQLKPSFVKDIYGKLKGSRFSIHDFEIDLPQQGKILINIIFKYNIDYKFVVAEETSVSIIDVSDNYSQLLGKTKTERQTYTQITVTESPGEYKLIEKNDASDLGDAINKIPRWCSSIHEDICAKIDTYDNFDNLRDQLDKIIKDNGEKESEQFSSKEIAELKEKLENLYSKFEELKEQNIFTENELKQLKVQINQAINNSENYPRGLWKKVTNNKLLQTLGDFAKSKEGKDLIVDGIKRLLQ